MLNFRRFAALLAAALAPLFTAPSAVAQLVWGPGGVGGSSAWNYNPSNLAWFNGATDVAWKVTNTSAQFGGTAGTVTVGVAVNVASLDFTTADYTLQGSSEAAYLFTNGSTFTVANSGTTTLNLSSLLSSAGSATFTKTGAGTLATTANLTGFAVADIQSGVMTAASVVGSGGSFTKTGAGQLTLGSSFTNFSGVTVSSGLLLIDSATFDTSSLTYTLANTAGAILAFDVDTTSATVGALAGGGTTGGIVRPGSTTIHTLNLAGATDADFAGSLQDNGAGQLLLLKSGTANQTLSGVNTYTGATTLTGGTLTLSGNGTAASTSLVTIGSAATLALDNTATLVADRLAAPVTINGGTLRYTGNGSASSAETLGLLTLGTGASTLEVNKTSGQSATLTFSSFLHPATGSLLEFTGDGTVAFTSGANSNGILGGWAVTGNNWASLNGSKQVTAYSAYTSSLTTGATTDNVRLTAGATLSAATTTRNTLALDTSSGSLALDLGSSANTLRLNAGGLLVTGANSASITNGKLTSNAVTHELSVFNRADLTVGAAIVNTTTALSLTKAGAGTLTLSGANTYTGDTNILAGALLAATGSAIPDSSTVTVASAGTFRLGGATETVGGLSGAGTVDLEDGHLTVSGTGLSGSLSLALGSGTLTAGGATSSFGGVISGTGGLVKTGGGTLTLSAAQTYSGNTRVEAGSLLIVDESLDALPDANTLTLAGGTFGISPTTIAYANETLGVLTVEADSSLQLHTSTTLASSLAFADSSAVSWVGKLYISGYTDALDTLRFGTDANGLTSAQLASIYFVTDSGNLSAGISNLGFVSPVPEPSTCAALAGLAALAVITLRRRA